MPRKTLEERFWAKVDRRGEDECWPWEAHIGSHGYGTISIGSKNGSGLAHRVAYELAFGPVPEGEGYHGTCVCHRCDNPLCVNPAHLFLGTNTDNIADRIAKGRIGGGPRKLSEVDVRAIRQRCAEGYSQSAVAQVFGVNQSAISKIVRRELWRHI